jgi:predicted component of type VI protein secretion system
MHLVPPKGTLQLVDKEMHKVKSYAEKQGISFEEALIEKRIIAIIKNKQDRQWLIDNGVVPAGNQAARRKQIKQRMEEMNEQIHCKSETI